MGLFYISPKKEEAVFVIGVIAQILGWCAAIGIGSLPEKSWVYYSVPPAWLFSLTCAALITSQCIKMMLPSGPIKTVPF